jgi:hypothetical protein
MINLSRWSIRWISRNRVSAANEREYDTLAPLIGSLILQ